MKEQHIIKNRIKPPFHSYPPSSDIPRLPEIKPEDAVAILKSRNWSARVIKNRHITCLRQIITPLLESDSLPQDFDQVVFENVVIEQGDLTELEIPFKLYFSNAFFLGGLHLNQSRFTHLDVSGYIGYALSLTETKGQPIVNLANLQADQIYVYEGEGLDCFDISTSTIGRLTLASTTIKRHITLHDNVDILDGLWLENLSIEQEVNLRRCAVQTFFRIHNVSCSGNIQLVVCDLNVPLSTRNSSCIKLNLSETNCSGRLDFRNLSFQELDVSNTTITGQILLELNQLQQKKDSAHPIMQQLCKWDVPLCLSPQKSYALQELVSVGEQLIVLYENFHRNPGAEKQELYCAYHLADVTWGLRLGFPLTQIVHWVAKQGFGYILLPWRIIRTMIALVGLSTYLYIILVGFGAGNLVFSDGIPIFHDGVRLGILNSLYFSILTFSSLAYGDIYPVGSLKLLVAIEVFIGVIVIALFTVSIARKLFRW
jgi:hypothetical protein